MKRLVAVEAGEVNFWSKGVCIGTATMPVGGVITYPVIVPMPGNCFYASYADEKVGNYELEVVSGRFEIDEEEKEGYF